MNIFDSIRAWAFERKLIQKGDVKTQCVKLQEEVGELAKAIIDNNDTEVYDAIGDCVIVLTNLAAMKGWQIEDCLNMAYIEIKNRTGTMQNGSFIKDEIDETISLFYLFQP